MAPIRSSTRSGLLAALVLLAAPVLRAEESSGVKGVNPAENLTKSELLPKHTVVDDDRDITVTTLTLKYDRAFPGNRGFNVELPLAHFDAPFGSDTGIGDLNLRYRLQFPGERWTFITGGEVVVPIASADSLGSGKWQTNVTGAAVHPLSSQTFVAVVAKQLFSVAGARDRDDIVQGQYRVLLAHSTRGGWWFLADPQLAVDYDRGARSQFSLDFEVGRMVAPLTGVWVRAGSRVGGNWRKDEWSVSGGVRVISF